MKNKLVLLLSLASFLVLMVGRNSDKVTDEIVDDPSDGIKMGMLIEEVEEKEILGQTITTNNLTYYESILKTLNSILIRFLDKWFMYG